MLSSAMLLTLKFTHSLHKIKKMCIIRVVYRYSFIVYRFWGYIPGLLNNKPSTINELFSYMGVTGFYRRLWNHLCFSHDVCIGRYHQNRQNSKCCKTLFPWSRKFQSLRSIFRSRCLIAPGHVTFLRDDRAIARDNLK